MPSIRPTGSVRPAALLAPALLVGALSVCAPTIGAAQPAGRQARALSLSRQALKNYMLQRYRQAAVLYRKAWLADMVQHVYLYNAARAAQRGRMLEDAERDYGLFLRNAPATSPERPKALKHLREVRKALVAGRAGEGAEAVGRAARQGRKEGSVRSARPRRAGREAIGWVLAVAGGVSVAGGAAMLYSASADQSQLDRKLEIKDGEGKIIGIGPAAARREQERINTSLVRGYVAAGLGLAAVGLGAYLVAASPGHAAGAGTSVRLVPGPTVEGLGLALSF